MHNSTAEKGPSCIVQSHAAPCFEALSATSISSRRVRAHVRKSLRCLKRDGRVAAQTAVFLRVCHRWGGTFWL